MTSTTTTSTDDYRKSHLERGQDYDSILDESEFDDYMARVEAQRLDYALARVLPAKPRRYLDFACGTGRITRQVEDSALESFGVDISASMLAQARRKCPRTTFFEADVTRQPLALGQFDLVTSFRFFGNAQDELRVAALRAINGLLHEGGYLIINNHRNPNALQARLHRLTGGEDDMDLTPHKLYRLLEEAGFEVVWQSAIGFWIWRSALAQAGLRSVSAQSLRERMFSGAWWCRWSIDSILVARKVSSLPAGRGHARGS
jgi:ubiquinone/menaquinone biosynthesis C-methylase UbiE